MRSKLALAAIGTAIDRESNNITVFSILEQINAPSFPVIMNEVSALYSLDKEAGDVDDFAVIAMIELESAQLVRTNITGSFQGKPRTRVRFNVRGLVISGPGLLRFSLRSQTSDALIAEYTVTVIGPPATSTGMVIPVGPRDKT